MKMLDNSCREDFDGIGLRTSRKLRAAEPWWEGGSIQSASSKALSMKIVDIKDVTLLGNKRGNRISARRKELTCRRASDQKLSNITFFSYASLYSAGMLSWSASTVVGPSHFGASRWCIVAPSFLACFIRDSTVTEKSQVVTGGFEPMSSIT